MIWHPPFYAVRTQIQGMVGPTLEWVFPSQFTPNRHVQRLTYYTLTLIGMSGGVSPR